MKKIISIFTTTFILLGFAFFFSSAQATIVNAECMNAKGKMSGCKIEDFQGSIKVTYLTKANSNLNKTIDGKYIKRITGGEYSRRRVAEAVLLTPWLLFSKKKRDTFGVEFTTSDGKPGSVYISTKKKYGHALKTMLQSVSGLEVIEEDPKDLKRKDKV